MSDQLGKLQGKWQQVHYERDGVVAPVDEEAGWQPLTEIAGNRFVVTLADGSVLLEGAFKLFDDDGREPKAVDWLDESGPIASDHPILAIYEVTDTTFVFCAAYDDGAPRPKELKTYAGQVLRRMQRV